MKKLFFFILSLLIAFSLYANELYSERPDILSVEARSFSEYGRYDFFQKLKRGSMEMIAQLLEMYPDQEIYFLARDAEYMFDMARAFLKDDEAFSRIHLLNISRANMRSSHIREYLAQEGISENTLRAGKKVLFVDTGFSGTIPNTISSYFPSELHGQLQTHLICSSNSSHPSSRVFLRELSPSAVRGVPGRMHGTIVEYEHIPHYTNRSNGFIQVDGRWIPVSVSGESDGPVARETSQRFIQDILAFTRLEENKNYFQERRMFWREINTLVQNNRMDQLIENLSSILDRENISSLEEASVRDLLEIFHRNMNRSSEQLNLGHFSLPEVIASTTGDSLHASNKMNLIQKYPQWAPILENPDTGIPNLRASGDLTTLGSIMDVIEDEEIERIFAHTMAQNPLTEMEYEFIEGMIENPPNPLRQIGLARFYFSNESTAMYVDLLHLLIEKTDNLVLMNLVYDTFSKPHTEGMSDLIRMVIEKGDNDVLINLASQTFSKPHTQGMGDLIRMLIEKGDNSVLKYLAHHTFSQPHTEGMRELIRMVIEKGDNNVLRVLTSYTFSQPLTEGMGDLIRMMIEKGDNGVLIDLAQHTFSQPHTEGMNDLIRRVTEKGDKYVLSRLAMYTFSKPHTEGMGALIRMVIEKAENSVLKDLAQYTFSKPHTEGMSDLIRMIIEKGDNDVLRNLAKYTFFKPHTEGMSDLIRMVIEKGDNSVLRDLASSTFSKPHTEGMSDLIRMVIEKGDNDVLRGLAYYTFSKPHTEGMLAEMALLIQREEELGISLDLSQSRRQMVQEFLDLQAVAADSSANESCLALLLKIK